MKPQTTWLIVVAVAVVAVFLFMRNRGPTVTQIGGNDNARSSMALQGLSALAPVAEAEFAAQNQLAIQMSQERIQGAAINASVETARLNAGAAEAAAERQAAAQETNSWLSNLGNVIIHALPFIAAA